jgi:phosphatidate cytidylyltransferase
MLKQRILTAAILIPLFLAALFWLPELGWSALVLAVVMVGAYEWGRLAKLERSVAVAYLLLTFIAMACIIGYDLSLDGRVMRFHLPFYATSALFWLIIAPLWLSMGWQVRQPLPLAAVGWIVLIPTGMAMMDLRFVGPKMLLACMALVWVADTAAYFAGKKFGKHKLAPSISPGKTWEGVIGAMLGVSAYAAIVGGYAGLLRNYTDYLQVLPLCWLWVALSVAGDLFESAIKRQAGAKDSGALLPGHGGILDRIDAQTSTLPLVMLALILWLGSLRAA